MTKSPFHGYRSRKSLKTKAPVAVIYRFDPTLSQHTQVVDACGFPHTIQSGEIITQTFLQVGKEHFASVGTQPPGVAGTSAGNALTVDLKFVQFNFEPIGRSGEEDRYLANIGFTTPGGVPRFTRKRPSPNAAYL